MSDSVRPHRWQPTRLPHPWDSPGKNTGVGCHFLLQCMKVKSESEVAQSSLTLSDPMDCSPPGSSVHGISQGRTLEWVPSPRDSIVDRKEHCIWIQKSWSWTQPPMRPDANYLTSLLNSKRKIITLNQLILNVKSNISRYRHIFKWQLNKIRHSSVHC